MFGALMGTLSSFQKASRGNVKMDRRAEIEARVKERVQKEKEELSLKRDKMEEEKRLREEDLSRKQKEEKVVSLGICRSFLVPYSSFQRNCVFRMTMHGPIVPTEIVKNPPESRESPPSSDSSCSQVIHLNLLSLNYLTNPNF